MIWALLLSLQTDQGLTAKAAVEQVLTQSPSLKSLEFRLGEAKALVDVATRLENPELRISDLRSNRLFASPSAAYPFEDLKVGIRWTPPALGSWSERRAEAERRVDQLRAEGEKARRDLIAWVRTLHASTLGLEAQIELAKNAVQRREELKTLTKLRLEHQAATVLDQSLADLDYLDALTNLENLEAKRRHLSHELGLLLGLEPGPRLRVTGDPNTCSLARTGSVAAIFEQQEALMTRAEHLNPKLESLDARLQELDAEAASLALERIPWIDHVQVEYVFGGAKSNSDYFGLQLGLTLPILDRKTSDLEALSLYRSSVEEERKAERQDVRAKVQHALEDLLKQTKLVERYEAAEPLLEKGLERLQRAFEASETDLLQLALMQTRIYAARRAKMQAVLECQLTQIELERLVGSGS